MKLRIKAIEAPGHSRLECVVLEALRNTDIGKYILFDIDSSTVTHTFWFPDMQVKCGDLIYLYTTLTPDDDGFDKSVASGVHRLFWELPKPIWTKKEDCAVLIEAHDWSFQSVASKAA